jgi:hypothetical protein
MKVVRRATIDSVLTAVIKRSWEYLIAAQVKCSPALDASIVYDAVRRVPEIPIVADAIWFGAPRTAKSATSITILGTNGVRDDFHTGKLTWDFYVDGLT